MSENPSAPSQSDGIKETVKVTAWPLASITDFKSHNPKPLAERGQKGLYILVELNEKELTLKKGEFIAAVRKAIKADLNKTQKEGVKEVEGKVRLHKERPVMTAYPWFDLDPDEIEVTDEWRASSPFKNIEEKR